MKGREVIGLLVAGGVFGLCVNAGQADAHFKHGQWYVRKQPVTLQLVGQTCCNPRVTFYRIHWGTHKHQGLISFPCGDTHAVVTFTRRTRTSGKAWIAGCGVLKVRKLRN